MDINHARAEFEAGRLVEAIVEPADDGNGWMILLKPAEGDPVKVTDHHGTEKVYHTLDRATEVAKGIGFHAVRVEEGF
jgi:hypothetical protein